jgi:hypothetical protein
MHVDLLKIIKDGLAFLRLYKHLLLLLIQDISNTTSPTHRRLKEWQYSHGANMATTIVKNNMDVCTAPTLENVNEDMADDVQTNDRFFLLESTKDKGRPILHDGERYRVCPVVCRKTNRIGYINAPDMQERAMGWGFYKHMDRRVHGRRINNEVELFVDEAGEVRSLLDCRALSRP